MKQETQDSQMSYVMKAIKAGNLYQCIGGYETNDLLWLHRHIDTTIKGYDTLSEIERNMALQLCLPIWKILVPVIETHLTNRACDFTAIGAAQVILQEEDLQSCAFCKQNNSVLETYEENANEFKAYVVCNACGGQMIAFGDTQEQAEQSAMRDWNRRA